MRLCGVHGLEGVLVAGGQGIAAPDEEAEGGQGILRRRRKQSILPVLVSSGADLEGARGPLSSRTVVAGAVAAVPACSLHLPLYPSYFRIDSRRLFSSHAWEPVIRKLVEINRSHDVTEDAVLVVEADTVSRGNPRRLLLGGEACGSPGDEVGVRRLGGEAGVLHVDQAVWGLTMLRSALQHQLPRGRVSGVILAGTRWVPGDQSTVVVDARAAVLSSILAWAHQSITETTRAREMAQQGSARPSQASSGGTSELGPNGPPPSGASNSPAEVRDGADAQSGGMGDASGALDESEGTHAAPGAAAEHLAPADGRMSRSSWVLAALERTGSRTRELLAPYEGLLSALPHALPALSEWLLDRWRERRATRAWGSDAASRVLLYDTDDEDSFRWIAWQVRSTMGPGRALAMPPYPDPPRYGRQPPPVKHSLEESTWACSV